MLSQLSALHDSGTDAVGYYGTTNDKDKEEVHKHWHDVYGSYEGIWPKHLGLVVRHSLPPDFISWVQEFSRAGQDGLPASACIVYSDNNIKHLSYWLSSGNR